MQTSTLVLNCYMLVFYFFVLEEATSFLFLKTGATSFGESDIEHNRPTARVVKKFKSCLLGNKYISPIFNIYNRKCRIESCYQLVITILIVNCILFHDPIGFFPLWGFSFVKDLRFFESNVDTENFHCLQYVVKYVN